MADVVEAQSFSVAAYTHGTDKYLGIESISVQRVRGMLVGVRKEGELVPSALELAGTDEGPITLNITHRSKSALATLADLAAATVTATIKVPGTETTQTLTITGVVYDRSGLSVSRDAKGSYTLSGKGLTASIT